MQVCLFVLQLFQTWSEEGEVEDETHEDEPGVGRWTVVVGPEWAVGRVRLVQTSEIKKQRWVSG